MPSLNFKQRFVALIESGQKRQTIRKTRKRPFRTGDTLYLFTGMRTANCRRLGTYRCIDVQTIVIDRARIEIEGRTLTRDEMTQLARSDGFFSAEAFLAFFQNEHELPLLGQLIRW